MLFSLSRAWTPGSNGTNTRFVAKLIMLQIRLFLGLFWTQTVLHLRAFVANQVLSRIRTYLGLFCPDFYSDIEDFTQILCRYLPKKLAAKTSGREVTFMKEWVKALDDERIL